jgi:hypothetical protein
MEKIISDLLSILDAEIQSSQNQILGGASSFDQYQKLLGKYQAFSFCKLKVNETVDKYLRDQESF